MKKIFLFTIILYLFSCFRFQNKVVYKQLSTDKNVYITCNYLSKYNDSVSINLPIKYEISKIKNFGFIEFELKNNNKILMYPKEYVIFNKDYKILYDRPFKPSKERIDEAVFYLISDYNNISNKKAKEILSKYNIEFNKWGERFKDTIQLATYAQFKKDFPEIFNELNAVGDTLIITTREENSKYYKSEKFPIKW